MQVILTKTHGGWVNGNDSAESLWRKTPFGGLIHADFKQMRNYRFHKKYFTLLQLAFEHWQPGEVTSRHGVPEKNFERFRKDIAILSGHYHVTVRLDGSTQVEADSISFANMDEETFEKLYSATIDVILKRIPTLGISREEIDNLVDKVLAFA